MYKYFPFELHSAAVSDSHLPCHAHAVLWPGRSESNFSRARLGMCELIPAIGRRPVGYLPAFGFFRLPRGVPRRLLQEAYQFQMQVPGMKPNIDNVKLIILVQGHECLYSLQHKDYDNNLVKYNCWKVNL
jgi:hypothetical protein